ncbi:MAG TPA: hypothetical protein VKR61_18405 [Bryobacteraceae bacterium]|nr:hypothetical protein [Bryobacteraceae bacterium]
MLTMMAALLLFLVGDAELPAPASFCSAVNGRVDSFVWVLLERSIPWEDGLPSPVFGVEPMG